MLWLGNPVVRDFLVYPGTSMPPASYSANYQLYIPPPLWRRRDGLAINKRVRLDTLASTCDQATFRPYYHLA